VADFAARLFGHPFTAGQVIKETLVTFTEGALPTPEELVRAMTGLLPDQLEDFRRHPLARWGEREFGVEPEDGGRLKRRVPRTLVQATERLARETGRETEVCAAYLREILSTWTHIFAHFFSAIPSNINGSPLRKSYENFCPGT
jgi:hypothetical protein